MEQSQTIEMSYPDTPKSSDSQVSAQFAALMHTEHWLKAFMTNLLAAHQSANGLDFKTAEALLARERATFEAEVAVAMRIFRLYPHLFHHEAFNNIASA